ncbi:MAG: mechanosensitive ion channel [Bacteroidetes bacterium]|jgi:hypothetical protein|nr:mechanosensitive ion channel [Bacteroidota bacterium]
MEITELQFSNLFLRILLWGSILFVAFRGLRFILKYLFKTKNKQHIDATLLITETITWIVFFSGFVWSIKEAGNIFIYIILAIVLILLFWVSRYWIKDTIAGVIFRSSSRFTEGDMIQSENYSGIIKKFRSFTIELENKEGKTIFLPYGKLLESAQIKSESISKQSGYTFLLNCADKVESSEIIAKIKNSILNLPWSSAIKKPVVQLIKHTDNNLEIEVTVYAIDKTQQSKIEKYIKEKFETKK